LQFFFWQAAPLPYKMSEKGPFQRIPEVKKKFAENLAKAIGT
jgi:hypothetical protein